MATLAEILENDLDAIYNVNDLAVVADYYPAQGGHISAAVFLDVGDELLAGAVGTNPAAVATVRVRSSVIQTPETDDVVEIAGDSWRVMRVLSGPRGEWVLSCAKDERIGAR